LLGGLEALVSPADGEKLFEVRLVKRAALALEIRRVGAFLRFDVVDVDFGIGVGAFVPVDAEPLQVFDDAAGRGGGGTGCVGVFEPKDETTALAPGKGPVEKRGAGASDVEIAGGAGGKTGDDFGRRGHGRKIVAWRLVGRALGRSAVPCSCPFGPFS
jgi:hypothetical protein